MLVSAYGDMFYAIDKPIGDNKKEYKICKVFYDQAKCKNYIEEVNYEREHQVTEEQYTD
jgi:hypothetical protein